MKPPTDTIDLIRSTLQTGVVSGAVEQAAARYAQLSQDCAARLERIAAMLEKGSDYQALQAAEEEPPLLDLAGVLSFGGEKAWLDFCQAHQLPIAPRLDARTVQALDRLYAQGVTANHPLYKDFRAAVLSRENDKALRIVRTILKLNPGDENARSELLRLENRQWQELLEELRAALKTDDEERIATLAEKITREVPAEKRAAAPELAQAEGIRRALRLRQAEAKIPGLVAEAEKQRAAGDWEAANLACELAAGLIAQHEVVLTGALKAAYEAVTTACMEKRAATERQRAFERALTGFQAFAQEAETRLMTGLPPRLAEAAALDEHFIRRWRELENHALPVADDTLAGLRQTGMKIRSALEHARRALRTRALLSSAALAAFLAAVGALAWHGWQARAYALDLSSYKARQMAGPAARLAAMLKAEQPLLLRWPYLRTRVEEAEAWTRQGQDLLAQAEAALRALEADFPTLGPKEALGRLEDARAQVSLLPGDLAAGVQQRVTALKTQTEIRLASLGQSRASEVRAQLESLGAEIKSSLSYEKPSAETAAALVKLDGRLAALEAFTRPEAASLQLPADLEAQIQGARQRIQSFQAELKRLEELRGATAGASSLADYRRVLARWQDVPFAEAAPAAAVLNALPTEEQFLAALLMGGDLVMWKAAIEDVCGAALRPETPDEADLKLLLALRDDPNLNGLWENTVTDHSGGRGRRVVWSLGPLTEARVGDTQQRWSGRVFDPHPQDGGAAFTQVDFKRFTLGGGGPQGQSVGGSRPAAVDAFMRGLQLERVTDANGGRFERSLLATLDRVMAEDAAPALARAYVMQELERMTRDRPFAWGLHLCPSLRADLAELHRLLGDTLLRSEDWMLPRVREQLGGALEGFFSTRRDRRYEKEALARRQLVQQVGAAGVRLAGFVDTDRSLRLNQAARAAAEFWLPTPAGPVLLSAQHRSVPQGVPPLTPALFLPLDRQQALQGYRAAVTGVETRPAQPAAASESPFLQ